MSLIPDNYFAGSGRATKVVPIRQIVRTPRGSDGLFIQPKEVGPEREVAEAKARMTAAAKGDYADTLCGRAETFDPVGDYLCGGCNQYSKGEKKWPCLLVSTPSLDPKQSSCRGWETPRAGDPEQPLDALSIDLAAFGTSLNGGFGCHRCPYQEKAVAPDSVGRNMYCKVWNMRVEWNACCAVNGNPTTDIPDDVDTDLDPDDAWENEGGAADKDDDD